MSENKNIDKRLEKLIKNKTAENEALNKLLQKLANPGNSGNNEDATE